MHSWTKLPDTKEPHVGNVSHFICKQCGCRKEVSKYSLVYMRSGISYSNYTPECVDMGRRSSEPLD